MIESINNLHEKINLNIDNLINLKKVSDKITSYYLDLQYYDDNETFMFIINSKINEITKIYGSQAVILKKINCLNNMLLDDIYKILDLLDNDYDLNYYLENLNRFILSNSDLTINFQIADSNFYDRYNHELLYVLQTPLKTYEDLDLYSIKRYFFIDLKKILKNYIY